MKSYKDLPREVVMNAPVGAMWYLEVTALYYEFKGEKAICIFSAHDCSWDLSCRGSLEEMQDGNFIPLPNVKIPWDATHSPSPVLHGCNELLVWPGGVSYPTMAGELHKWGPIEAYQIIDPDYVREELADNEAGVHPSPVSANENFEITGCTTADAELMHKLQILTNIRERFPLIADGAKAAMEQLVGKWAELN
jgi:hypothetical protein